MNKKKVRSYCLTLPLVKEDYPFGPDVQVFKIKEKLFALMTTRQDIERVNLKCNPEEAIILREIFEDVIPGYHMNKNLIILTSCDTFFVLDSYKNDETIWYHLEKKQCHM